MSVDYDTVPVPVGDGVITEAGKDCANCGVFVPQSPKGRQYQLCTDCRREARESGTPRESAAKGAARSGNWEAPLQRGLADMGTGIGMMIGFMEPFDGKVIMDGSPRLAEALIAPARANPKVRKRLESVVQGGAWGAVAMAVGAMLIPILAHHNMLPVPKAAKPAPPRNAPDPSNVGHVHV